MLEERTPVAAAAAVAAAHCGLDAANRGVLLRRCRLRGCLGTGEDDWWVTTCCGGGATCTACGVVRAKLRPDSLLLRRLGVPLLL